MRSGFLRPRPFPLPSGLLPCLPSDSGTQLSAFPFTARCLASQWLPQRLALLPFGFRPLPLAFALGSVTQLKCPFLKDTRQSLAYVSRQLDYNNTPFIICQHLFSKFFNKFLFFFLFTFTNTSVSAQTYFSPFFRVSDHHNRGTTHKKAGANYPCFSFHAASSIFSIKIPYPIVGSFTKTCVTAPTSFPPCIIGLPLRSDCH